MAIELVRTGTLIENKYREYFLTTLTMSGSASIAAIVDRIMIAFLLNGNALAAATLTAPIVSVINIIFSFFIYGGNTIAMTYKGKGDGNTADKCFTISLIVGSAAMLLFGCIGVMFRASLTDMAVQNNHELYQLVYDYLLPQFFLGVLVILVNGTCAYIRSDGIKKLAMYVPIVANVVNLLFDYIFMGVMGYGIMSAAWATNVGYFTGFLLVLKYFRSEARSVHFAPVSLGDIKLIFEAFSNGMATALSHLTIFIRTVAMNAVILAVGGSSGMQILAVCMSGYNLAGIFYMGTSQTMLPIVGALYGEKDYDGLRSLFMTGIRINFWICMVLLVLFEVFTNEIAFVFGLKDPSGMPMLKVAFRLFALSVPAGGLVYVLRAYYQSTGYEKTASVLTLLEGVVFFVPALYMLSRISFTAVWMSFFVAPTLSACVILFFMQYRAKREGKENFLMLGHEEEVEVVDFSVENKVESAVEASEEIRQLCIQRNVSTVAANILALSAEELCTNTAKFAYGSKSKYIDLFLKFYADKIILKVRDNGAVFNPTTYIDESGKEVTGLKTLRSLPSEIIYNRVIGFNVTIVILKDLKNLIR